MKQLYCPLNGLRNISEFVYGGEYHPQPDHINCSAREWAEHVFFDENKAGLVIEWWCHLPTSYWFLVERDTVSDEILRSFPSSEFYQQPKNTLTSASPDKGGQGE
jgi:sarcosine oxidase subunit delta